jgi:hypothetical protein
MNTIAQPTSLLIWGTLLGLIVALILKVREASRLRFERDEALDELHLSHAVNQELVDALESREGGR